MLTHDTPNIVVSNYDGRSIASLSLSLRDLARSKGQHKCVFVTWIFCSVNNFDNLLCSPLPVCHLLLGLGVTKTTSLNLKQMADFVTNLTPGGLVIFLPRSCYIPLAKFIPFKCIFYKSFFTHDMNTLGGIFTINHFSRLILVFLIDIIFDGVYHFFNEIININFHTVLCSLGT